MKLKLFNLLMILLFSKSICAQTVLTVVDVDNKSHEAVISTASCMFFRSDSLVIIPDVAGDTTIVFSYSDVRKLFFSGSFNDNNVVEVKQLQLFPNPVDNYFIIMGLETGEHQLSVSSMNGVEIIRRIYRPGRILDVSFLQPGFYLVRVGNGVAKFVKK